MDEGSTGNILTAIRNLFRKSDTPLEECLREALEEGDIPLDDIRILNNVLELENKHASEVMVPRPDMVCIELDDTLAQAAELIVQHGHSRIPVYRENRDHIVGVLHAKDIVGPLLLPQSGHPALSSLIRPTYYVPETTNLKVILHDMQSRKSHLAIVTDEYGGTAGMLTLENVLEEIVGEIGDEHDALRPEDVQVLPDGSQLVSGRLTLDEINERFGLELASEQVETIGGHICEIAGSIPAQGYSIVLGPWRFLVHEADPKHIETLRVERAE
ncbi:MAG: hemolysin family protein [Proteobacteria bacterium]|nr:hemolysin family protein [Pseudomonadota bacterium]MBU1594666.1 hemolysin family protein [Pseudomonadota bacterium]